MRRGRLVTIDAMGCQKDIAQKIVASQADDLLDLKDNQPTHADAVTTVFEEALSGLNDRWLGKRRLRTATPALFAAISPGYAPGPQSMQPSTLRGPGRSAWSRSRRAVRSPSSITG